MPARPHPPEVLQRLKDAVEECLRDGYDPYCVAKRGAIGKGSAVREAARRLTERGFRTTPNMMHRFITTQTDHKNRGLPHYLPDWTLFAPPGMGPQAITVLDKSIARWILTAAQDDTDVHLGFWTNINAFANSIGAQVSVSGFTYQHAIHTDKHTRASRFREEVRPFLRSEPMECGPVLWCAEMNILPTAVMPLSGMDAYPRGRDAVFPHAKHQLVTVPQAKGDHVPVLMTTGAVTIPNYIDKKAGQKAKFHHILGFVLVEVNSKGESWCYQVHAQPDGSFQHLDTVVRKGQISKNNRIEAIVHGDVHAPHISQQMIDGVWGGSGASMMEALRPSFQFFHDLYDFRAYSRHTEGDHFHHVRMGTQEQLSVPEHIAMGVRFLTDQAARDYCKTVVVKSNHDARFDRWAKKPLPTQTDLENSLFWHKSRVAALEAIRDGDDAFDLLLWAMRTAAGEETLRDVSFIPYGGSFTICHEVGGIECGWHGDEGPNGAKPSPTAYAKMAKRIIRGHSHSPGVLDGLMTVGILGDLDQEYNTGPSSWKHASAVVYPNGKRTLVFLTPDGRWRP